MIELNIDVGEMADEDEALYAAATTVNLACGGHAGDPMTMRRGVALAHMHRLRLLAHPSYPDRDGFGRRARFSDAASVTESVRDQCHRLAAIAAEARVAVLGIKLHGALYHDADADLGLARSTLDAARAALEHLTVLVGPPGGALAEAARTSGLAFEREGFADRRYDDAGRLVPRTSPGALLTDPEACVAQALLHARSARFDTLCMHSDTEGAVGLVRAVRAALEREGFMSRAART